MYKLYVSEYAHQDLDNIVSYIAVQLSIPVAAGDFLSEVDKCYTKRIYRRPFDRI